VTGEQAAALISYVSEHKLRYEEIPLEQLRTRSEEMARMYEWFARVGYQANIAGLRRDYPEVGWHTFEDWAARAGLGAPSSAPRGVAPTRPPRRPRTHQPTSEAPLPSTRHPPGTLLAFKAGGSSCMPPGPGSRCSCSPRLSHRDEAAAPALRAHRDGGRRPLRGPGHPPRRGWQCLARHPQLPRALPHPRARPGGEPRRAAPAHCARGLRARGQLPLPLRRPAPLRAAQGGRGHRHRRLGHRGGRRGSAGAGGPAPPPRSAGADGHAPGPRAPGAGPLL
jgi:hypothetical protein